MSQSDGEFYRQYAGKYAACRPIYPRPLLEYVSGLAPAKTFAWDCGTGNGQAAKTLATFFKHVVGTDHSLEQIALASTAPNVEYRAAEAEASGLVDHSADLITVAQAVHWFDLEQFYREVNRILKTDGIFAVWCYRRPQVCSPIGELATDLWNCVPRLGASIKLVEQEISASLPFPFVEMK